MERVSDMTREGVPGSEHIAPDLSASDGTKQSDAATKSPATTLQNANEAFNPLYLPRDLGDCDWEQLQEMFSAAMEEHARVEGDLQEQTKQLLKIFVTWSQITISRDEDRSFKRFKTRMQHVQNSELQLEEKRRHYVNVVKAFQSALALLK